MNEEMFTANKENLPTLSEVVKIYEQRRREWNQAPHPKTGRPRIEMYYSSRNERCTPIQLWERIDLFGLMTAKPVVFRASGIEIQVQGIKYAYDVLGADGFTDMEFRKKHTGEKFYVEYDPDDLSTVALYREVSGGDKKFVEEWKDLPARVKDSFVAAFWNPESRYLADYVDETGQNMWVRPNQLLACSLPYSPITDEMKGHVMDVVTRELLTKKGLRTLSPKNENYKGRYEGDQPTRDRAYHQGTVWPWLIGAYIETGLRLYGKQFLPTAKELLAGFEEDMTSYGLCSVAEVYDGNPPFLPGGCISQAWSVGEVLRSLELVKEFEKNL